MTTRKRPHGKSTPAPSARLAQHLSFWVPGLGQLYRRDWLKGVALLVATTLLSEHVASLYPCRAVFACAVPASPSLLALHLASLAVLWAWGICDAASGASGHTKETKLRRCPPEHGAQSF